MTLPLMLCSVLIAFPLTCAAQVLHAQERAANRPVRWIWAAAMLLTVLFTALVPLRERFALTRERSVAVSTAGRAASGAKPSPERSAIGEFPHVVRAGVDRALHQVQSSLQYMANAPQVMQRAAGGLWVSGSAVLLLALLGVYRHARRTAASWQRARVLGTDVRLSESAGPAVIGINPMEIVLPAWVLQRAPEEQELVLRHELEHVRAHDPALLLSACIAVAVMPWNPLLWYLLSRTRLAVEIDCDRRVLRRGAAPHTYGRLLLDLSAHPSSLTHALPALSYHTSHLERRLLAMTARPARFVFARRVTGGVVAAAALLAACESKLPTSADVENMDATSAIAQAAKLRGIDSTRTVFVVDGKVVSSAEAKRLESSRISSIEVVKSGDRTAQVRLRTRGPDSLTRSGTRSKTAFEGLFVIDGKIVSSESANSLSPDRIESVEVLKGDAATQRYSDPRARDGVIVITTKK